jgi:putative transposase
MLYNTNHHHRKSIRLKEYDYSQAGLYFITICVQNRLCLFGNVVDGKMILNNPGIMIENEWFKLPQRFPNVQLHECVVMPNHFHAIIEIVVGATLVVAQNDMMQTIQGQPQGIAPTKPKTVGDMVGAFQSIVTVEYIHGVKHLGWQSFIGKLWQRNYWEHIIRNEQSYQRIAEYIINNPQNWDNDKLYNR